MKSRLIAITIAVVAALSSLAMQGPDERPSLYIFSGPGPNGGPCGPCERFERDFNGPDARLRNSLRDDFRSVVFYDVRTQPSLAKSYDVDRWPTFISVDQRGNVVRKVTCYFNPYTLWLELTKKNAGDQVAPVTQSKLLPKPATPKPATPKPATPKPATEPGPTSTSLKPATEYLPPNPDPLPLIPATPAAVDRPTPKPATLEPMPMPTGVECVDGVCILPVPVAGSSDSGSPTGDKWLSVLKWGATTAIAIAAPEVAIPASVGLTAIGYGLSWMRKRRASRRGFTPHMASVPHTDSLGAVAVIRDTEIQPTTTNHYVVKEIDRKGEAYKEALRRTVAAYKSDKPGIVDVAGQIEHVAQEILRGQSVEHRANTAPRPGIWTDEDSH